MTLVEKYQVIGMMWSFALGGVDGRDEFFHRLGNGPGPRRIQVGRNGRGETFISWPSKVGNDPWGKVPHVRAANVEDLWEMWRKIR